MESQVLLNAENIDKSFPGVHALKNVSFDLRRGEIHAICGENGAGKSTLIKILNGIYDMDSGNISINGETVDIKSVQNARDYGIAYIPQEVKICPDLTVAENIFMGEIPKNKFGIVKWNELYKKAEDAEKKLGESALRIGVRTIAADLTMGQRQLIEIIRALTADVRIITLDEPTSSLSESETEELFELLHKLRDDGIGIVYVSHKIKEITQICDRVTVLKDGEYVGTRDVRDIDANVLINMMVGRDINLYGERKPKTTDIDDALKVENLSSPGKLDSISYSIKKGEVLGLFGIVGAGRTEMANAVFGLDPNSSGKISVNGKNVTIRNPRDAMQNGIGYITEDRHSHGLVLCNTVRSNISMTILDKLKKLIFLDMMQEKKTSSECVDRLNIKVSSDQMNAENLSGGNQQKVVVSKWLCTDSDILIFDEPTRGIDVGAKAEIYKIIKDLAMSGKAIIMISSEIPEILGVSDRIIVMRNGRITADLDNIDLQEQDVIQYAIEH